jgi:AhpD family alkylhydroperoxidase
VAEANGCEYCLSVHTAIGNGLKIDAGELDAAREARSSRPATEAALKFARRVVDTRGHVSDDDIAAVRAAGYDDAAIGELVALVALNVFTNFFNSVAATEVDFPRVAPRLKQAA